MNIKKISLLIGMGFLIISAKAQIVVSNTLTVEELVTDVLLGEGVIISNITYNGVPGDQVSIQAGTFDATGTNFNLEEGVLMSTSYLEIVNEGGTNNNINQTPEFPNFTDADLAVIANNNVNNACVIEFDFTVASDSVKFDYVFSSAEYPGFTCSSFNDVFGFFLSGPDINGPFTNDAVNIALIPNSDVPVAINTLNSGTPANNATCLAANPNYMEDSQYFEANSPVDPNNIQIEGFTHVLTAEYEIICGATYHIKMAVANAGDQFLQTAVMLKKGSFTAAGEVFVNVSPTVGGSAVANPQYADVLVAGCSEFDIELIRPNGADIDSILVDFGGTAVEGEDYILGQNDTLFFFPDGIDTLNFAVETLWDGVPDENEVLTVTVYFQDGCGNYDSTFASLPFVDPYQLTSTTNNVELFCPTEIVSISAQGGNGIDPYEYNWGNFGTSQEVSVDVPDDQQYYYVGITDACGFEVRMDSVLVTNSIPDPLGTSILPFAQPDCPGEPVTMESNTTNGNPPYSYVWSTDDGTFATSEVATTSEIFDTDVFLMIVDSCGTQANDSTMIIYPQYDPLTVMFPPLGDNCPTEPVALDAVITGGAGDTEFAWSQIEGSGEFVISNTAQNTAIIPSSGMNIYQVEVTDHCFRSGYFGINPGSAVFVDSLRVIDLSNIANVITPNNDNKNDFFVIEGVQEFDDARLEIYNRWGRLVFNTDNYMAGFADGKFENAFSGNDLEDGTYYYVIDVDKGECTQSGNVEILRSND